jgi:outer membrane protein W
MKNVLAIFSFITVFSFSAAAQDDLKPFKVDVSVGYAIPGGEGSKGGVLFAIEPKYAVIPNISVGLRMEAAVVARFGGYDENGNINDVSVKAAGSYILTGDYYFKDNYSFRPFAGAGLGAFTIASAEVTSTTGAVSGGTKFGGLVRAGFEAGHFRMGVEYNVVPKTKFDGYDENGNPTTGLTSNNSYIGIKIGVCIGGGRRSSSN